MLPRAPARRDGPAAALVARDGRGDAGAVPDDLPPELDDALRAGLRVSAFVEAGAGLLAFVILAFSAVYEAPIGLAIAGALLVVAGVAGLRFGDVPLLQIRVLVSREWARRLATVGRVVAVLVGIAWAITGVLGALS